MGVRVLSQWDDEQKLEKSECLDSERMSSWCRNKKVNVDIVVNHNSHIDCHVSSGLQSDLDPNSLTTKGDQTSDGMWEVQLKQTNMHQFRTLKSQHPLESPWTWELVTMVIVSPLSRVVGPLPNGHNSWLVNGGDPNYLLTRVILQVGMWHEKQTQMLHGMGLVYFRDSLLHSPLRAS